MSDASYYWNSSRRRVTVAAAAAARELRQLADGSAGIEADNAAHASGDSVDFATDGQWVLPKTAGFNLLDGGRAYWDYSANAVSFRKVNDRDFYLGRVVNDAAAVDTSCTVALNVPEYGIETIDLLDGSFLSVATGTPAAGGFGLPKPFGGSLSLELTATSEAQCIDLFSVDRVDKASNPIGEWIVRVAANGSTSDVDLIIGLANATSTTDADLIPESVFVHIDGGSLNLYAESDDGTTDTGSIDTTIDFTAGSAVANRFEIWMDARNPNDVQIYIDGVLVLAATVFTLAAAVGPLGLLILLEKVSGTATAGKVYIDRACLRTAEQ